MSTLTPKQEAFASAYLHTGFASKAYRAAYSAENMSDNAVWVEASRLLDHPMVARRIQQLRDRMAKKTEITAETITQMLLNAYKGACDNKQNGAAVSASIGLAKVHGLIENKLTVKSEDKTPADMTEAELYEQIRTLTAQGSTETEESQSKPH